MTNEEESEQCAAKPAPDKNTQQPYSRKCAVLLLFLGWLAYTAGDAFIVYPGEKDNVVESLRHEVLFDGFQNYMALKRLEEKKGREFVVDFIKKQGVVDFNTYPHDDLWFINYRQELNRLIND